MEDEDLEWSQFAEATRWPDLTWVPLRWLEGCFDQWLDLPPEAVSPLAVLFCLCASIPSLISAQRRRDAATLRRAAQLIGGSANLLKRARNFTLPLQLAVTVMPVDIPAPGAPATMKFGWTRATKEDPSLHNLFALLGLILLRDAGLPEQRVGRVPSAGEVLAEAMTLLTPGGVAAVDPETVERAARRGAEGWRHHDLLPQTRELLLQFRREPGGELGMFVESGRLQEWLERVGADDVAA